MRADEVTAAGHARALLALLDHWGLERPHVVAHDLGGLVALRAHLVQHDAPVALATALREWLGP